jgi:hypothetical protein
MKYLFTAGKISLWVYVMGICAAALVWQPPWLTEPRRFFLLAMAPLAALTLWELRDLNRTLKSEVYGESAG